MIKTIALLGILSVILITFGRILGGQDGMIFALVISLVMNAGAYFFSDKIALSMSGAKPLTRTQSPEVYQIVEELTNKMRMPMPKLYITPAAQANAFATGRSPSHASVAVTAGIMKTLSHDELKGVLAHELGHVKNRDILISSIAAVLASAISFLGNMALFSGFSGGDEDEGNGNAIFAIIAAILIPIAASLIQFAISRQREFAADSTGATVMGTGKPLANALLAIHDSTRSAPMKTNPAFSSLYIENPFGGLNKIGNLFSTHPPVEERVKRLREMR